MVDAVYQTRSGLRIGHAGLGYRGEGIGSVAQMVHDGDTIKTRPIGNLPIRFLGVDTAEISFKHPETERFVGLGNDLWNEFLSDPFAPKWDQPEMDEGLKEYLTTKTDNDTAKNHYAYADLAQKSLESEVINDIKNLNQTNESFQFFLAFADEIMDGYGRLLAFVNRNQPIETATEQRPLSYNERLLKNGFASPYFIFPNISPFYTNTLEDNIEISPVKFRNKIKHDNKLQNSRMFVRQVREDKRGIFDNDKPLKLYPFELRFLAQKRLPNRWVIDLTKEDNILINPQKYYTIQNLEDRFFIPYRYVPLFIESGWKIPNL